MRFLAALILLVLISQPVFGQHMERIQKMWAEKMEADAQRKAIDAMRRAVKQQFNEQAKMVDPLDLEARKQWTRKLISRREYFVWEIKKQNVKTNTIYYNTSMGYVVDRTFRKVDIAFPPNHKETVDFGWPTLDEAIVKRFGDSDAALAKLPEIPGWGRYYDLSSDDQIAELKRRAAIETRERAIVETGKRGGREIGEALAPEMTAKVLPKLGNDKLLDPLQLVLLKQDQKKFVYETADQRFVVHQYKDDSTYEAFDRKSDGSAGKSYPELHNSYRELRDYLSGLR